MACFRNGQTYVVFKLLASYRFILSTRACRSKHLTQPASVAQLDARPTGDQEVAGSISARSATLFRGD